MKDELSALLDGSLDEQSSRSVLDSMRRDSALRDKWDAYCLIGDVLRGDTQGAPDFVARVMSGIRSEPTLLAPPAAGDDAMRRAGGRAWQSVMPLAASIMGVAAVGWVAYTLYPQSDDSMMLATTAAKARTVEASARQGLNVVAGERDESHHKFVFVHQAMNGGGPIPGAVQYVRTVSDVRGDVRR